MMLRELRRLRPMNHRIYETLRTIPDDALVSILDRLVTDTTLDLGITKSEWLECLHNREVKALLDELGIPLNFRKRLFDLIDTDDSGTVTSSELQELLRSHRTPAQALELAGCHLRVREVQRHAQNKLKPELLKLQKAIRRLQENLSPRRSMQEDMSPRKSMMQDKDKDKEKRDSWMMPTINSHRECTAASNWSRGDEFLMSPPQGIQGFNMPYIPSSPKSPSFMKDSARSTGDSKNEEFMHYLNTWTEDLTLTQSLLVKEHCRAIYNFFSQELQSRNGYGDLRDKMPPLKSKAKSVHPSTSTKLTFSREASPRSRN